MCAVGRTMFSLTEYMVQRVDGPFNIVTPTNKGRGRSFSKFLSEIRAEKSSAAYLRVIELFLIYLAGPRMSRIVEENLKNSEI